MIDLSKLDALTKAATPEWKRSRAFGQLNVQDDKYMLSDEDAKYAEATCPAVMQEIIALIRKQEAELASAREAGKEFLEASDDLLAEALAVFDLMLEGCSEQKFGDYENGNGDTIGPRMDQLHSALRSAVSGAESANSGTFQGAAVTVDTPEFETLANKWFSSRFINSAERDKAWNGIIAHIDARVTQASNAAFRSGMDQAQLLWDAEREGKDDIIARLRRQIDVTVEKTMEPQMLPAQPGDGELPALQAALEAIEDNDLPSATAILSQYLAARQPAPVGVETIGVETIGKSKEFESAAKALHRDWTPEKVHHLIDVVDSFVAAALAQRAGSGSVQAIYPPKFPKFPAQMADGIPLEDLWEYACLTGWRTGNFSQPDSERDAAYWTAPQIMDAVRKYGANKTNSEVLEILAAQQGETGGAK